MKNLVSASFFKNTHSQAYAKVISKLKTTHTGILQSSPKQPQPTDSDNTWKYNKYVANAVKTMASPNCIARVRHSDAARIARLASNTMWVPSINPISSAEALPNADARKTNVVAKAR
jgi:hypothetical protein